MINHILLPVDINPAEFHLADYNRFFSHLNKKRFSAFFVNDLANPKSVKPAALMEMNRYDMQEGVLSDAQKLKLDVSFLSCPANHQLLTYQSHFADLIVVSPITAASLDFLVHSLSGDLLTNSGCPLFLTADILHPYEEIIFLFDYDLLGLDAVKSFIALFGESATDKKVTVVTVSPDNETGVLFEKCLINHIQKAFSNVGILPMTRSNLLRNLLDFASKEHRPLLVMGKAAVDLLKNKRFSQDIFDHQISLFYCNQ